MHMRTDFVLPESIGRDMLSNHASRATDWAIDGQLLAARTHIGQETCASATVKSWDVRKLARPLLRTPPNWGSKLALKQSDPNLLQRTKHSMHCNKGS